jgi:hypothetical protein
MRIKQIWDDLENDKTSNKGILMRRYSGSLGPNIFIAIQVPEKLLCMVFSISTDIEINVSLFTNLQEIKIDVLPHENITGQNILIFKLINKAHKDIFAILCEDLISTISQETNETKLLKILLNRFEKWKSLFNKFKLQGLTSEEQRGLFGELYFLRNYLKQNLDFQQTINTWVGPSNEIRDFQYQNWALEVKTTIGNNHQKVHISSERQLDTTHLENLFLFHISLEKAQESGESLPHLVNSIEEYLSLDTISLNRFKSKLYEAGYFEQQENLYNDFGFHIRQENYYKVEDNFPRLQENELRSGVGDVKYSIILSQCSQYTIDEIEVFKTLSLYEK